MQASGGTSGLSSDWEAPLPPPGATSRVLVVRSLASVVRRLKEAPPSSEAMRGETRGAVFIGKGRRERCVTGERARWSTLTCQSGMLCRLSQLEESVLTVWRRVAASATAAQCRKRRARQREGKVCISSYNRVAAVQPGVGDAKRNMRRRGRTENVPKG